MSNNSKINIEEEDKEFDINIDQKIDENTDLNIDIIINPDAIIYDDDNEVDKAKVNIGITKRF